MSEKDEVFTIEEAADFLKISASTLYNLARKGKVPAQKVSNKWRFSRKALEAYLTGKSEE